jgi:hypothetical protein
MRRMSHSQEQLGIGDGAEEDAAFAEVLGDVLEHHARLCSVLECIVHAELH